MTKTCIKCNEAKEFGEFYPGRNQCKSCYRLRVRIYYEMGGKRNRIPYDPDPVKRRARDRLLYAVKTGKVQKPKTCEKCGGEGRIEGHHEDYAKPLDVKFLCRPCHAAAHRDGEVEFTREEVLAAAAAAAAGAD